MSGDGGRAPHAPPSRPRKRFGQHFLEAAWVVKLIEAAAPGPDDTYIEIGPGRGAVTKALWPRVSRLICVEIDRTLAAALAASLPPHVHVVPGDFLRMDVQALVPAGGSATQPPGAARQAGPAAARTPVRIIGNLPYNISTPILFKLLASADDGRLIRDATLMLQKEVADRIMAAPRTKSYGTLAVQVARLADVERLLTLPPGAFRPPPKVTSTVVRLRFRPSAVNVGDPGAFERIVRGAFAHRRKTVLNALAPVAASLDRSPADLLARAGVDPRSRPEDLTLADFARLSRAVL
jgi:16S rRNA (adenine1518-N6/adenine1519-N6)-dimethyltransferase